MSAFADQNHASSLTCVRLENSLYNLMFCNIDWERIRSLQFLSGCDHRIFIRNDILCLHTRLYNRILHQYTVFHNRSFSDFHPAEKNTIFYSTLNDTTVCCHGIFYSSTVDVSCRVVIAQFCIDRSACKQTFQVLIFQIASYFPRNSSSYRRYENNNLSYL